MKNAVNPSVKAAQVPGSTPRKLTLGCSSATCHCRAPHKCTWRLPDFASSATCPAIKRNSPFPAAWVLGNTNGYTGYMPTRESFAQGGYEVRTCGWSKWQEDADGIVVKESLDLLNQLKSR